MKLVALVVLAAVLVSTDALADGPAVFRGGVFGGPTVAQGVGAGLEDGLLLTYGDETRFGLEPRVTYFPGSVSRRDLVLPVTLAQLFGKPGRLHAGYRLAGGYVVERVAETYSGVTQHTIDKGFEFAFGPIFTVPIDHGEVVIAVPLRYAMMLPRDATLPTTDSSTPTQYTNSDYYGGLSAALTVGITVSP